MDARTVAQCKALAAYHLTVALRCLNELPSQHPIAKRLADIHEEILEDTTTEEGRCFVDEDTPAKLAIFPERKPPGGGGVE